MSRATESTRPDVEAWAFHLLSDHLAASGHRVANVRRPDLENRTTRDVDFVVEVDGRTVAVEVTQLSQTAEWWNILRRIEAGIRAQIGDRRTWPVPGWLVFNLELKRLPNYRDAELTARQIVDASRAQLTAAEPLRGRRRVVLRSPARETIDVTVDRLSSRGMRLSFISGHEAAGGLISPRALRFVDWLLASKVDQTRLYETVWILVIDAEVLIDADDLRGALEGRAASIPRNWERLWFLPATDRSALLPVDLQALRR